MNIARHNPARYGANTETTPTPDDASTAGTGGKRRYRPLTLIAVFAAIAFAIGGIGSPLLGQSVFASTDELTTRSPYFDAGGAGTVVQNTYMDDTYTFELSSTGLFFNALRHGDIMQWNPYNSGGLPLGATPNYALASPLTLPYYLLPTWLAPAYEKLLEIFVALGGTFLFLRRLRLGRPAALLGGLVFASSAFMVMWTNWPQTRVAAFVPVVFWAAERLVQRRRVLDGALLALASASLLLGGFPAVAAFGLFTVVPYLVFRIALEYPRQWRRRLGLLVGGGAGLLGGVLLAAFQLLPFAAFYQHWFIEGRTQEAGHLPVAALVTLFAPYALGGVRGDGSLTWYLHSNMIEALSFIGATAVVLILLAVAAARFGLSRLPRGAWLYLLAAAAAWFTLIYVGSVPLRVIQHLPVFSTNAIGRGRSVLGFLLAALAAIGFERALRWRRRPAEAPAPGTRAEALPHRLPQTAIGWLWGGVVWIAAACVGLYAVHRARAFAYGGPPQSDGPRVHQLNWQLTLGAGLALAALLGVLTLWWSYGRRGSGWRRIRFGAAALVPLILAGQALSLVIPYYPRTDRSTFYPTTDVHSYLATHLGEERFAGTWHAMFMGVDAEKELRALTGHGFINERFATLVRGIPGRPIPYPTYINLSADLRQAQSPIMDLLGVRYFVTSPRDTVFGTPHTAPGDGSALVLRPGQPVRLTVARAGALRAIGFTPAISMPRADPQSWVEVTVTDATGAQLATAKRLTAGMQAGSPFLVPVALTAVAADADITATVTLHTAGEISVAATAGQPAVSWIGPADDGLTVAYAGSSVIYERTTAQPRIRWASTAISEPDESRRMALLTSGAVDAGTVVLDGPGTVEGKPAQVRISSDGGDEIRASVTAQGAGYLVVADADQVGWAAEVDGASAPLVAADEGLVAVPIPAGTHVVRLHYAAPYHGVGTWLSLASVLGLLVILAHALLQWNRRRRQTRATGRGLGFRGPDGPADAESVDDASLNSQVGR
jgi:hypothetical protein